jgi:hypothetical protein
MFRIIDTYTLNTAKKTKKKSIEEQIGNFAVLISTLSSAQRLVNYAEELGLSIGDLGKAFIGTYITFGIGKDADVDYSRTKPRGISNDKILNSFYEEDEAMEAIEEMATKKIELQMEEVFDPPTYRELALRKTGKVDTPTPKKSTKKQRKPDLEIKASDHLIIINDEIIGFKKPNDTVDVTLYQGLYY